MLTREVTVINPTGIHTRPATQIIDQAKKFSSEITLSKGEKKADLKSLIQLMKLGAGCDDVLTISAHGDDEQTAIETLSAFISTLKE